MASTPSKADYNAQILSKQNILGHFLNAGYSSLDHLNFEDIENLFDELNGQQEQFDRETLQELIDQCKTNSKGQIKIQQIVEVLLKAEKILVDRHLHLSAQINTLERQRNKHKAANDFIQVSKIESEIVALQEELTSNHINLEIIRKPFPKNGLHIHEASVNHRAEPEEYNGNGLGSQGIDHQLEYLKTNTHTFTWIFELTIILLLISLPIYLFYNCFLNVLVLGLILFNILSGYVCRTLIRICAFSLAVSLVVDGIGLAFGLHHLWDDTYVDNPNSLYPFLRLCIALYGAVMIGKVIVLGLHLYEYNTDETEKKLVSAFGLYEIELSHDYPKKNLFPSLNMPHHQQTQLQGEERF